MRVEMTLLALALSWHLLCQHITPCVQFNVQCWCLLALETGLTTPGRHLPLFVIGNPANSEYCYSLVVQYHVRVCAPFEPCVTVYNMTSFGISAWQHSMTLVLGMR